ncbi:MAG TPA: GNAT family N-acetyltransferase [Candidatus Saccharimonadales bacterium]|nr:GNAT family N-acetyltransferase [Candidatus Saccharimonadales bacterium]
MSEIPLPYPIKLDERFRLELLGPESAEELDRFFMANPHLGEHDRYFAEKTGNIAAIREGLIKVQQRVHQGLSLTCIGRYDGEIATSVAFGIFPDHRAALLGYFAAKKFEGQHLVTRTCRYVLSHGFDPRRPVDAVWASISPENVRSQYVSHALGFVAAKTMGMVAPACVPRTNPEGVMHVLIREAWQVRAE